VSAQSFTACVHDVALGEVDLCIGNFWVTIERLRLATFSSTLYTDDWRLVVKKEESDDGSWLPKNSAELYSHMKTPLMPFSNSAWMWIMFTVFYMSVALHIVESSSYYIESPEATVSSGSEARKRKK
jgi:ABC-type amino acid transport substrate-binding protein